MNILLAITILKLILFIAILLVFVFSLLVWGLLLFMVLSENIKLYELSSSAYNFLIDMVFPDNQDKDTILIECGVDIVTPEEYTYFKKRNYRASTAINITKIKCPKSIVVIGDSTEVASLLIALRDRKDISIELNFKYIQGQFELIDTITSDSHFQPSIVRTY